MENASLTFTPDPENVIRLIELAQRYGLVAASQLGRPGASDEHVREHGHPLSFGCCRGGGESPRHTR